MGVQSAGSVEGWREWREWREMNGGRRDHEASVSGLWERRGVVCNARAKATLVGSCQLEPWPMGYQRVHHCRGQGKKLDRHQLRDIFVTRHNTGIMVLASTGSGKCAKEEEDGWLGATERWHACRGGKDPGCNGRPFFAPSCTDELAVPLSILK